ncbi:MAG: hypothetical protein ABIH26_02195 [Candidatus Eisenbacteria bacterium]
MRTLDKNTRSVAFCLLFLLLFEAGLRAVEVSREDGLPPIRPTGRPVLLVMGSSRTKTGISPDIIDATLAENGIRDSWTANLSLQATTCFGLYRHYMETVHPWASRTASHGIVAIEVGGAALNDGYVNPREEPFLAEAGFWRNIRAGKPGEAARSLLWKTRLSRSKQILRELATAKSRSAALKRKELPAAGAPHDSLGIIEYLQSFEWGTESRGWVERPFRRAHPNTEQVQEKFETVLLRDFKMGGLQTEYLVRLIRQIRRDGFTPALYAMPVTSLHRSFYPGGRYAEFLAHARRVATEERILFVDLDTGHGLDEKAFRDSHHLHSSGAIEVSKRLALRLFLPLLAVPPSMN